MSVVPQEALSFLKGKELRIGFSYEDVWKEEHAKAFTVAKCMELDLLKDIHDSLTGAIAEGVPYKTWAKDISKTMVNKGWWGLQEMTDPLTGEVKTVQLGSPRRLETIFNVNMRSSYNVGAYSQAMGSESHPYLMYRIGSSKKHREDHVSWDGLVLPKSDPWWEKHMPPNGWGCKCYVRAVSEARFKRLKDTGIVDEQKRTYGKPLSYKPIKTKAPMDIPKPYVNRRKGETYVGVRGIDPGFEYNPADSGHTMDAAKSLSNSYQQKSNAINNAVSGNTQPTSSSLKTPVSAGITPSRGIKNVITYVTKLIDSVHGDGKLPGCPATLNNTMNPLGSFTYGFAIKIEIKVKNNNHPELTAVHEIGHYLDYFGLNKEPGEIRMTDSFNLPKVKALLDAMKNTMTIVEGAKYYSYNPSYQSYYLRDREIFARAYAQYIATKSGDALLIKQLKESQNATSAKYLQWPDSEFRDILKAMDDLMEDNGWLKKK